MVLRRATSSCRLDRGLQGNCRGLTIDAALEDILGIALPGR